MSETNNRTESIEQEEDGMESVDNGKMIPVTVRFEAEAYKTMCDMAKEYDCSLAEIVRLSVDDALIFYLGMVKYVDVETGKHIISTLGRLETVVADIRNQLLRIGVNYNQELKLKHIENKTKELAKKLSDKTLDNETRKEIRRQYDELILQGNSYRNMPTLDVDVMDNLMTRYEKATEKLGGELWRIAPY